MSQRIAQTRSVGRHLTARKPVDPRGVDPRRWIRSTHPGAFTLVEMLVAVTLVLLMMLMFGQIFELATGSLSQQQGLADNDQRARTLQTILRTDLQTRSFQNLIPFYPGEPSGDPKKHQAEFRQRMGYFYISENDPNDETDDVLQFTVWPDHPDLKGRYETWYYGKASLLTNDENGSGLDANEDGSVTGNEFLLDEYALNPNQPEHDNGTIFPDQTGRAPAAEISYFLRNGNLYRRVLLIRESPKFDGYRGGTEPEKAYEWDGSDWVQFSEPLTFMDSDTNFSQTTSGFGLYPDVGPDMTPFTGDEVNTGDFWNDFDYSAFRRRTGKPQHFWYAQFHNTDDLDNEHADSAIDSRLAIPHNRFGHHHTNGQPREFLYHPGTDNEPGTGDDTPNAAFFGRFTRAETAHPFFNYPQFPSIVETISGPPIAPTNWPPDPATFINGGTLNGGNPMTQIVGQLPLYLVGGVAVASWGGDGAPGTINVDDDGDGVVDNPEESGWPGTDDIGYRTNRRRSEDVILSNVEAFDIEVWDEMLNEFVDVGHNGTAGFFRQSANWHLHPNLNPAGTPVVYGPTRFGNPINNRVFDTWHNSRDPNYQFNNDTPNPEDQPPFRPMKYSPVTATPWAPQVQIWQRGVDYQVGELVFPDPAEGTAMDDPEWRNGFTHVFRCEVAGTSDNTNPPVWTDTADPNDSATWISDGPNLKWSSLPNEALPLRAIRITVRFRDDASGQVRQTSIVESLKINDELFNY